jgi:excisionase family DNA binding protein
VKTPSVFVAVKPAVSPTPCSSGLSWEMLTMPEAAKRCRCSLRHLQKEAALGRLRVARLGKLVRIDCRDLEQYLNDRKVGGSKPLGGAAS